jgi:hypothetical protein
MFMIACGLKRLGESLMLEWVLRHLVAASALMTVLGLVANPAAAQQPEVIEAIKRAAAKQGFKLTDEEARQLAVKQLELQMRFQAMGQAAQQGVTMPPGNQAALVPAATGFGLHDENALLAKINQLRGPASPVDMTAPEALDLAINGRRYIDPEGLLANVTVDPGNGDATFFVGRSNRRVVKFLSGHSPDQPLTVGEIALVQNGFTFSSVTGVNMGSPSGVTTPCFCINMARVPRVLHFPPVFIQLICSVGISGKPNLFWCVGISAMIAIIQKGLERPDNSLVCCLAEKSPKTLPCMTISETKC